MRLILILAMAFLSPSAFAEAPCPPENYFPPPPGANALLKILQDPANPECQDPPKNSYRDYSMSDEDSPMGIGAKYRVQRSSDGNFEIQFNVDFFPDGSLLKRLAQTGNKKALNKEWTDKANKCLKQMDDKIPGPNGSKVRFRVSKGSDPANPPPVVRVGIADVSDTPRSHSRSWAKQQMTCAVIAHELMHLTGLPDEYKEQVSGYKKDHKTGEWKFVTDSADHHAYDCRKTYEKNALMADQDDAWTDLEGDYNMNRDLCSCANKKKCQAYRDKMSKKMAEFTAMTPEQRSKIRMQFPKSCPSGFRKNKYSAILPITDKEKAKIEAGEMLGLSAGDLIPLDELKDMVMAVSFEKRPTVQKNVLEKRHINAILYPYCFAKNQKFIEDAQNAYRTSEKNGGKGCANTTLAWPRKSTR